MCLHSFEFTDRNEGRQEKRTNKQTEINPEYIVQTVQRKTSKHPQCNYRDGQNKRKKISRSQSFVQSQHPSVPV